jgi:hypothetical protein
MASLTAAIIIIVILAALVAYLFGILLKIYFRRKYVKSRKDNDILGSEKKNQNARTSSCIEEKANENTESLYEAILGEKNHDYYLTKFEDFDRKLSGFIPSWNWPAFFFGGTWALYRKMYGWFFAFLGTIIITGIIEKAGATLLSLILFFVLWVAFTIFANALYHKSVKGKISNAQHSIRDKFQLLVFLRRRGGVHSWVIWVCCLLPIIGILLAIALPQMAHTFIKT